MEISASSRSRPYATVATLRHVCFFAPLVKGLLKLTTLFWLVVADWTAVWFSGFGQHFFLRLQQYVLTGETVTSRNDGTVKFPHKVPPRRSATTEGNAGTLTLGPPQVQLGFFTVKDPLCPRERLFRYPENCRIATCFYIDSSARIHFYMRKLCGSTKQLPSRPQS